MPTTNVKVEETIISGIWKISKTVPVVEVIEVAQELVDEISAMPVVHYRNVHVRSTSKSSWGISFIYDCGESTRNKVRYDAFFNRITDKLKRRFGNEFVGWDVTNDVWMVK